MSTEWLYGIVLTFRRDKFKEEKNNQEESTFSENLCKENRLFLVHGKLFVEIQHVNRGMHAHTHTHKTQFLINSFVQRSC